VNRRLAFLLALVVAAPLASAQPPGATPPTAPAPAGVNQQQLNRREKIKNRIRALRAYTLTEELKLDEATAGKLFPVLAKYDNEFDRLLGQRADIAKRLAAASNGNDARAADKIVDEAVANQHAFWEMEDKRLAELRKILNAQQTARLLVVLPPLERKIENQLRNAIQGKGPGAGGGGPGPGRRAKQAAAPDDDDEP
jgi:hypothetical protein